MTAAAAATADVDFLRRIEHSKCAGTFPRKAFAPHYNAPGWAASHLARSSDTVGVQLLASSSSASAMYFLPDTRTLRLPADE